METIIILALSLLATSITSYVFFELWRLSSRQNKALQKNVDEQYEKLQNAEREATKERLKNVALNSKHESLTKKYDFMRTNTRKFNVGDEINGQKIAEVDVRIPSLFSEIIQAGHFLLNSILRVKFKYNPEVTVFIYRFCKKNKWIDESEIIQMLQDDKSSFSRQALPLIPTISPYNSHKHKPAKKRTTKKQVKSKK